MEDDTSTRLDCDPTDTSYTDSSYLNFYDIYDYSIGEYLYGLELEIEKMLWNLKLKENWKLPKKFYPIKFYNQNIRTKVQPINLRPSKTSMRTRWFPRKMINKNYKHGEI